MRAPRARVKAAKEVRRLPLLAAAAALANPHLFGPASGVDVQVAFVGRTNLDPHDPTQ